MAHATRPLVQGFAAPDLEAWRALAERAAKGASLESLAAHTPDGVDIQPLYGPGPAALRQRPQTRRRDGDNRPWEIRALVAHPDPVEANRHVLEALEGGASSVLLRLDPGGRDGCAVRSAGDLARALNGVALEAACVALDAGGAGLEAAEWLGAAAKDSPAARLAFHLDPVTAAAQAGGREPPAIPIQACAGSAAGLLQRYPHASLFLASGRAAHEAGGSAAQELGMMAACALAYAKALAGAGLPMDRALAGIVLGLAVDQDVFVSIAKLRAARDIWAKFSAACGAPMTARIEARSSGRMLAKLDPWTNLLRLTCAGFAAATGGAEAIVLESFTAPLGGPAPQARRLSRGIQLILMEESHLGRVDDPAAGSWFVEALTDRLARDGWAFFQAIEARGGIGLSLASGFVAEQVAGSRKTWRASLERRETPILGVTLHRDASPVLPEVEVSAGAAATASGQPGSLAPWRLSETAESVA